MDQKTCASRSLESYANSPLVVPIKLCDPSPRVIQDPLGQLKAAVCRNVQEYIMTE